MAKKKSNKPKKSEGKKDRASARGPVEDIQFVGRRITAKDAGYLSPTKLVLPLKFPPFEPPRPRPKKRSEK